MNTDETVEALAHVAAAKAQWAARIKEFNEGVDRAMIRLLHEAARNRMSAEQVAKASGLTRTRVRTLMKKAGLDQTKGKTLLAEQAARALALNSEVMGIEPREMDLTSPLAYLPGGSDLKKFLETPPSVDMSEIEGAD